MAPTVLPRGKGTFARGTDILEDVEWCRETGGQFVSLDVDTVRGNPAICDRVFTKYGLAVLLHDLVGGWNPSTWRQTLADMEAIARSEYILAFVADFENAPAWNDAGEAERKRAAAALGAATRPVYVTSYPLYIESFLRLLARAGCGAMPQYYGLGGGATSPSSSGEGARAPIDTWHRRWMRFGWRDWCPALSLGTRAEGPNRSPAEQSAYLAKMPRFPAAIGWSQKLSPPRDGLQAVWKDYTP